MASKYKILHFDTVDSVGNYDESFAGRKNGSGQNVTSFHTFNSKIKIATPIENIKSISLKTVEFPFCQFNVRSENDSNYIDYVVTYNGNTIYSDFTLRDKNYTSITTLLADINSAFAIDIAYYPVLNGFTVEFMLNPLDNTKIKIKAKPSQVTGGLVFGQMEFYPSILINHILGVSYQESGNPDLFIGNVDTFSYMNCTNNYNLQPDNYFNLSITNIQTAPSNANGKMNTFKVPLSSTFGEVIYWSDSDNSEQKVYVDRPNTTFDYVNLLITDRWGFPVYSNGSQISFTLNIEYTDLR